MWRVKYLKLTFIIYNKGKTIMNNEKIMETLIENRNRKVLKETMEGNIVQEIAEDYLDIADINFEYSNNPTLQLSLQSVRNALVVAYNKGKMDSAVPLDEVKK